MVMVAKGLHFVPFAFTAITSAWFLPAPGWAPALVENLTSSVEFHNGLLFVAQRWEPHLVILNSTDGSFVRGFDDSAISAAHFVRVHGGDVWITDAGRPIDLGVKGESVLDYTLKGFLKHVLGTPGLPGTSLTPLQFGSATDIAFSRNGSILYVADGEEIMMPDGEIPPINNRIDMLQQEGDSWHLLKTIGGNGSGPGELFIPHALSVDACDRLWVNDRNNSRMQIFRSDGTFLTEWSCMRPLHPAGLAIMPDVFHSISGKLLVGGDRDLMVLPFKQDCSPSGIDDVGECTILDQQRVITHDGPVGQVHSVSVSLAGDVFVVVIEDDTIEQHLLKYHWFSPENDANEIVA